jgi:Type IX secretion system membrane protein PorP/SprF
MQGGFSQKSMDLSALYFSSSFYNGGYTPGANGENIKPKISNPLIAMGLNFGHRFGEKFALQLGTSAHNINQPRESLLNKQPNETGLGMRINSQLGAIWQLGSRFSLRPAVLFQTQSGATELIAGTETHVIVGEPEIQSVASSIFVGAYSRIGDALIATGGIEFKGFRLGAAYDITGSSLKTASPSANGFEIALTYVKPNPLDFARKVYFPCARF